RMQCPKPFKYDLTISTCVGIGTWLWDIYAQAHGIPYKAPEIVWAMIFATGANETVLLPIMDGNQAAANLARLQEYTKSYLTDKEDYGVIPGCGTKPTLLKSGADKLCEIYGLRAEYEMVSRV